MKKLLQATLSAAVLTVLVISCGGSSLLDQAEKGISEGDIDMALAMVDSALAQNPNNPQAYFIRGRAYAHKAANNPNVADRKPSYQLSREALDKYISLQADEKEKTIAELSASNIALKRWSDEHNAAIALATNSPEAPQVDDPLQQAVYHLQNATTINPDSTLSFEVLAQVYTMKGDYANAVETYKKVMDMRDTPMAVDYDRLGAYYMQLDDYETAVDVLNEGVDNYPDSVSLVQKLTDSYFSLGNTDMGIKTLENLIERDPNNAQYHLVLGTQIYNLAASKNDEISANYNQLYELERAATNLRGSEKEDAEKRIAELRSTNQELQKEVAELTERAIKELNLVLELRPNDVTAYNTLGVVYQNKAAALFEERNATSDNEKAAELDAMAKEELRKAMKNYEKATELEPDNQEYWESLFRVYTALGMNEKAEEAMKKAGM